MRKITVSLKQTSDHYLNNFRKARELRTKIGAMLQKADWIRGSRNIIYLSNPTFILFLRCHANTVFRNNIIITYHPETQ